MQVLVAYASRFGATRELAERIGQRLVAAGLEATVAAADVADPTNADAVVLGSGIYEGHWAPAATHLAHAHAGKLASGPLWLFSSGPIGSNPSYTATDPAEVAQLRRALRPRDHQVFWGAWDREKADQGDLGRLERFAAKHLLPEGDFRDWPVIDAWADGIARTLLHP